MEDHKRTRQGVSAELLSYIYKLHMVHATNNYSYPKVHASSMSAPCVHHEIAMQLTCFLISSMLWNALDINNFILFYFIFSDFYFYFYFYFYFSLKK